MTDHGIKGWTWNQFPINTAWINHNSFFLGLFINLKRLFSSLSFICRTSSMFVDGLVVTGAFHFLPMYFTHQFGISQKDAALYGGKWNSDSIREKLRTSINHCLKCTGLLPTVSVVLGNICGSLIIRRFQLQPRHVALLLAIPSFIFASGLFASIGIKCDRVDIKGVPTVEEFRAGQLFFNSSTCPSCACSQRNYDPVCAVETSTNYFSPCYAGCKRIKQRNNTTILKPLQARFL